MMRNPSAWLLSMAVVLAALVGSASAADPDVAQPAIEDALALQHAVVAAIARAERSVVAIARYRKDGPPLAGLQGAPQLDPERNILARDSAPNELAAGVVIDREGYIVTNFHVLGDPTRNAYKVWVNRRPHWATAVHAPARVRAGDPWTDLAVLKIEPVEGLEPMPLGDAAAVRKGQFVIALGNPDSILRDGEASASWGIVSHRNASASPPASPPDADPAGETLYQYGGLIQTDVRLRFGTSGGALINLQGEMVGLITDLAVSPAFESSSGFAIPVDATFHATIDRLKSGRQAEFGFLGIAVESLRDDELASGLTGARVSRVVPGTPASVAQLREGDLITAVNERPVHDRDSLMLQLGKQIAEGLVRLELRRDATVTEPGRMIQTTAVLATRYLAATRPAYAEVSPRVWRGLRIGYATALPPTLFEQALRSGVPDRCLAVIEAERDSAAWKAGARAGQLLTQIDGRRVTTPDEFHAVCETRTGAIALRLASGQEITVPEP